MRYVLLSLWNSSQDCNALRRSRAGSGLFGIVWRQLYASWAGIATPTKWLAQRSVTIEREPDLQSRLPRAMQMRLQQGHTHWMLQNSLEASQHVRLWDVLQRHGRSRGPVRRPGLPATA